MRALLRLDGQPVKVHQISLLAAILTAATLMKDAKGSTIKFVRINQTTYKAHFERVLPTGGVWQLPFRNTSSQ
ncbi:MAG: hypothetical protein ACT4NL_01280 [Pseudomarimonas sp.]